MTIRDTSDGARAVVRTLVRAINEEHIEEAVRLFAEDYRGCNVPLGTSVAGRSAIRTSFRKLLTAFPDLTIRIHGMLYEDDAVVLYWSAVGTHEGDFERIPATGRRSTACGTTLFHFQGTTISEGLHVWDFAGLLRSMKLLPSLSGRSQDRQRAALERHFQDADGHQSARDPVR